VLFLPAVFFANKPENFTAFTALENIVVITKPHLAAAALTAARAFAPYITAELARLIYTWFWRITRFLTAIVLIARLRIITRFFTLARLSMVAGFFTITRLSIVAGFVIVALLSITTGFVVTTLFTPEFVHSIHLIRMICYPVW